MWVGSCGDQKRALDPLELKSLTPSVMGVGNQLQSSGRAVGAPNHCTKIYKSFRKV